jgi:hypothetical protein
MSGLFKCHHLKAFAHFPDLNLALLECGKKSLCLSTGGCGAWGSCHLVCQFGVVALRLATGARMTRAASVSRTILRFATLFSTALAE